MCGVSYRAIGSSASKNPARLLLIITLLSAPVRASGASQVRECAGLQLLQHTQQLGSAIGMESTATSTLHSADLEGSLRAPELLQEVRADVSEDGQSAVVSLLHNGRRYRYNLFAFSVFADAGEAWAQDEKGLQRLDVSKPRTFKSRTSNSWASAMLYKDGSITGLFDDGEGRIMHINHADGAPLGVVSLLDAHVGDGKAHIVQRLSPAMVLGSSNQSIATTSSPFIKVEDPGSEWPNASADVEVLPEFPHELNDNFAGQKWWPGCFAGDASLHDFKIGIIADVDAWQEHGSSLQGMIEAAVAEASFVFESQLHSRLILDYLKIYKSSSGAPSYAMTCSSMSSMLDQLTADRNSHPFQGALHLFTGCGNGRGTVGVAWKGTICNSGGYNTGINQFHSARAWLTFAHELGHNFGGSHSFENGQGSTGGIMDYGDGRLNGIYQFNTRYRKGEMCNKMNRVVNMCDGKFAVASDGELSTTTSRTTSITESTTTITASTASSTSTSQPAAEFTPVDGGLNRACRGGSANDNLASYYIVFGGKTSEECKALCLLESQCKGIEHNDNLGRCEVWIRSAGIGASTPVLGFNCLRLGGIPTPPSGHQFEAINGGSNQVCRGANSNDNSDAYYSLSRAVSLIACQSLCLAISPCQGIEYHPGGRCEVWTRPSGIQATRTVNGYFCYRLIHQTSTSTTSSRMTMTTTAVATATTQPVARVTQKGCVCKKSWTLSGTNKPCTSYCCNPDSDPKGLWCFVESPTCEERSWGYCSGSSPSPSPSPAPSPSPSPPSSQVSAQALEHFRLLNDLRRGGFTCPGGQNYGPNPEPLKFDCRLWRAAQLHSQDMADNNYFSHDSQDGRSPWDRASAQGISANAENIAAGSSTASGTLTQWKNSDGHCRNMMNPSFTLFAVGYGYNADSSYRHYWTQMLKSGSSGLDTSCLEAMDVPSMDALVHGGEKSEDEIEDMDAILGEPLSK